MGPPDGRPTALATPAPDDGAPSAPSAPLDGLTSTLYAVLRTRARHERRRAGAGDTLDTRAVVHEAFLRLIAQRRTVWDDRGGLLAAAGTMMRRVILDDWRRRRAERRGGRLAVVTLDTGTPAIAPDPVASELRVALARLAAYDPRLARVAEARYLGGFEEEEVARALGVTVRTVRRDWVKARGWLRAALAGDA